MRSKYSSANPIWFFAAGIILGLAFCALNRQIFLFVNGIKIPPLDWLMLSLTHLGNGMVAAMLVLLLAPFRKDLTIRTAIAMVAAGILITLIKESVPLPRPPAALGDVVQVLGPVLKGNSFPSGHTATVFALACSLKGFTDVRIYRGALVLAVLVGVSRVYIGAHFPLDVILGAFLGWVCAVATRRPADNLVARLEGPRPGLVNSFLVLTMLCGVYLMFFERMVFYNPWFLRPLGFVGVAAALFFLLRGRARAEIKQ